MKNKCFSQGLRCNKMTLETDLRQADCGFQRQEEKNLYNASFTIN